MLVPDTCGVSLNLLEFLSDIAMEISKAPALDLSSLNPSQTVLIIVDMVGGFAREGALASPRVGALISPIASLAAACNTAGIPVLALADCHTQDSIELQNFPPHCLRGTEESAVCAEIAGACDYTLIEKNSTNGFIEPIFEIWLKANSSVNTFLVVGDCTDICVQQFAVTAKSWYNTRDIPSRILVSVPLVDTYDAPGHNGDILNLVSLRMMQTAGVELCGDILYDNGKD